MLTPVLMPAPMPVVALALVVVLALALALELTPASRRPWELVADSSLEGRSTKYICMISVYAMRTPGAAAIWSRCLERRLLECW